VFTRIDNATAIAAFDIPSAAASTIRARWTSRTGAVRERTNASNRRRCPSSITTARADGATHTSPNQPRRDTPAHREILVNSVDSPLPDTPGQGTMAAMTRPPDLVKTALRQRLDTHQHARWPQLTGLQLRFRGDYAYINADEDGDVWPLCRLQYTGTIEAWGFAIHLASRDGYEDSVLPDGQPTGTPEQALDCALGLYLNDPAAWLDGPLKD
jgi:hypothetical protein